MNWKTLKMQVTTGWNFSRIVRLLFSVVIIIQAVMALSIALGILGALFLIQSLVGIGCSAGGCGFPANREAGPTGNAAKEIVYEEVKK